MTSLGIAASAVRATTRAAGSSRILQPLFRGNTVDFLEPCDQIPEEGCVPRLVGAFRFLPLLVGRGAAFKSDLL
jgi:hypothetical protein